MSAQALPLQTVAVLPEPGDNAAVASRVLEAGTVLDLGDDRETVLPHRIMEGHRFMVRPAAAGEPILSWGTPFASALRPLAPGDYVCTDPVLEALGRRGVQGLPETASAANVMLDPYELDESAVHVGQQVVLPAGVPPRTFKGYRRDDGKVGTRNHIIVVGVTSRSASFAEALAARFKGRTSETFDGVVAVAHTEGGEDTAPNNREFLLGVLAGCLSHPNVGAVLVVDEPGAAITADDVFAHHRESGREPLTALYATFQRTRGFTRDLERAAELIEDWIAVVSETERSDEPLTALSIALQCGGSDAFSGITANPLAGLVGAEVIRHGGTAVLAETDELIGAEPYVLQNVRSMDVARRFLQKVEEFKQRVALHGHTAEGNPSGGNLYRGLSNIVLKSLGAARKLPREVRLDEVIGYADPCDRSGYIFMDSPGNDLESVAGQIASGCNLIFFTTGNGSITNFPFVPTLKFVTTTARHDLMPNEMDVNAGAYLDGIPMEQLVGEVFDLTLNVASGQRTAGELAGHSQVSIWRDWKQTAPRPGISIRIDGRDGYDAPDAPDEERDAPLPGLPLGAQGKPKLASASSHTTAPATERVALVLPTSLCSGQVSRLIAERAAAEDWAGGAVDRIVALPHTEGCGVSSGANISTFSRVMTGSLTHPNVAMALLLEHGCEKTHNDFFRDELGKIGADPDRYGWASIQLGGGVEAATEAVREWFRSTSPNVPPAARPEIDPDTDSAFAGIAVGLDARGELTEETAAALASAGQRVVDDGGTVILPAGSALLAHPRFRGLVAEQTGQDPEEWTPTLAHGQQPTAPGWHIMRAPTKDWAETATGLVACGAHAVLVHVSGPPLSGHRLAPVLQVSSDPPTIAHVQDDLDAELVGSPAEQSATILAVLASTLSGHHAPQSLAAGNVAFQITRGLLGTSM
ncbi:UxaA family hydrolase [Sinomonas humi]|uniref:Altronate hydrolase n=1 Tax=Sinomonas humi TaxID=1338436 RepID=A0A0B2AQW5_9MICC|nr:UxaA family hydrolase [Sinomonas humi]KHL04369.1 altronate hydrolase [Sinomonas humi]